MPTRPADDERLDSDPTDELPILHESAMLDPDEQRVDLPLADEVTGEHTVIRAQEAPQVEELKSDLDERAAKIVSLQQDVARLSTRWADVDRHLTAKDSLIEELKASLGAQRAELDSRAAVEQRLTSDLAELEADLARLAEQLEQRKRESKERDRELAGAKKETKRALDEIARLKADLAAASREPAEIQALREEVATLTAYIANRRASWDELDGKASAQAQRISELERELAHRTDRQQRADSAIERELARAESLREQLVGQSRRAETFDAEAKSLKIDLKTARAKCATLDAELAETTAALAEARAALASERQALAEQKASLATAQERHTAAIAAVTERHARDLASAVDSATREASKIPQASLDEIARLEAELDQARSGGAAERKTARDHAEQLAAELDSAQRQLAALRGQLEQARADASRLEHVVIDKDDLLKARDEQLATLQKALDQKIGALQKLNAMDLSLQGLDEKMSERLRRTDAPDHVEPGRAPALVCLTSDGPKQYALTKSTMTIGRSSRCEIQILTQFVSREHARILVGGSTVVVEDLGSTNGIFVNAVRVDRQELRHGDLITVGETQFRFLESMAH